MSLSPPKKRREKKASPCPNRNLRRTNCPKSARQLLILRCSTKAKSRCRKPLRNPPRNSLSKMPKPPSKQPKYPLKKARQKRLKTLNPRQSPCPICQKNALLWAAKRRLKRLKKPKNKPRKNRRNRAKKMPLRQKKRRKNPNPQPKKNRKKRPQPLPKMKNSR